MPFVVFVGWLLSYTRVDTFSQAISVHGVIRICFVCCVGALQICVPMNYRCEHWFLCIIDMTDDKLFIYDSLPDEQQAAGHESITRVVVSLSAVVHSHITK